MAALSPFAGRAYALLAACLAMATVGGAACRPAPTLTDAHASVEALASAVLAAVSSRDEGVLRGLALSDAEFREVVWPELPAARPERNLPIDYVWSDLNQKSRAKLGEMLANHGGRHYTFVAVDFTGGDTRYKGFVVRRDSRLRVRDAGGEELTLRLFGSVLQTDDGRFKVFSYNVDD